MSTSQSQRDARLGFSVHMHMQYCLLEGASVPPPPTETLKRKKKAREAGAVFQPLLT